MVPYKDQEGSLEWQHYAMLVAGKLRAQGMRQIQVALDGDYGVFINYARTEGETRTSSSPVFGQTGGGTTTTTTGYVGRMPVYASTYTPPTFGITGYATRETTMYGRGIRIVIVDALGTKATGKVVTLYDGMGLSSGPTSNLMVVMPYILDGIFQEWPAPNGSTVTREVQMR